MSYVHEYRKHIASEDEQLPASDGSVVTYVGPAKADFETVERFGGGTPTVECSTSFSAPDGSSGTIVDQQAEVKYGWTVGGAGPVVAVTTKARVDLGSGVTSF
jgi:hypothetical protein